MATLKEWQDPRTGKVLARATDDGFYSNVETSVCGIVSATGRMAEGWGASELEGFQIIVHDEVLSMAGLLFKEMTTAIPQGAIILAAQARQFGISFAGGTSNGLGLGPSSDPDKYQQLELLPDLPDPVAPVLFPNALTPLAGAETIRANVINKGTGNMGDTVVTGGLIRVRVYYLLPLDLVEY